MTLLPLPLTLPSADMALAWLPVAVCMVDAEGHFRYVNDAFERIFGYSQAEALGMPMLLLVHPDDRTATLDAVQEIMRGQILPHFRNRYLRKDGSVVDIQWSARWLPEHHVRLAVGQEVTALRGMERRLEHRASHDPLTGLPNRDVLRRELQRRVNEAMHGGPGVSVLYIDLDGFKGINDVLGHEVGDRLLREVALALKRGMRRGDLVARVGGDEFVALLHDCRLAEDARHVADALRAGILALNESGRFAARIDASIGSACFPDHGQSPRMLLRHADGAMYSAKAARR